MIPGFGAGLVIPDLWQQAAVRALQQGKDAAVQDKAFLFAMLIRLSGERSSQARLRFDRARRGVKCENLTAAGIYHKRLMIHD